MEHRESRTELFEKGTVLRASELADQQRIDEKARDLTATHDGGGTVGESVREVGETDRKPDLGGTSRPLERVPNGEERQGLCEVIAHKKSWIEHNASAPVWQMEKMRSDIAEAEAQVARTPIPDCPRE